MKHYSLLGLWVCFATALAFGADIYVSPAGDDGAAGTAAAPLATIAAARDKADALKASGPVTVYLMGGTYYLTTPVVFGPANSGTATAPITYKNNPGQKPVVSGGIKVTTAWTTSSGSIMKTTIAADLKVDQLFLNGKRQILARYPNFNASQAILDGYASDALAKAQATANPTEGPGYIRAIHTSSWGGNDFILTKNGTTVNASWVGDNNRGSGMHGTYRMAENCYEFLDAAGEWFYRKSTGELFFWPPSGTTDLNTATVELASVTELLRFVGSGATSATSVKYIQFDGISFTHTYRSLFDGTGQFYEMILQSDWGMVRKGTVFMQNAENITIKNCLFDQVGGNGVFFSGYNRNHVVYNCDFEETGASCICLFGLKTSVRCAASAFGAAPSCSDKTPGPLTEEYPSFVTIDNNMMNHSGRFEKQTAGITLSATQFDTLRHNTIHNIPRAGINYCAGCWGGHIVEYNWVYDCVKETSDHGAFNAWGRDRNLVSNDVASSKLDAVNPTIVRYNRFESPAGMFGIDLDDQATNYYQTSNLLIGGGLKIQWNRYNTYLNNILIRSANLQFHTPWNGNTHYGARNIIVGNCGIETLDGNLTSIKASLQQWDSNIVYSNGSAPNITSWSQTASCGSQQATWAQWQSAGMDAHSSTASPGFVDTQKTWSGYLPRGDFNPPSSSIAITQFKFKPFPMDSFGVMGVTGPNVGVKGAKRYENGLASQTISANFKANRLTVSYGGEYKVAITSVSGRTLTAYHGKGQASFTLDTRRMGDGVYFAVISTKNGFTSHRFIVSK
jgi:hypothetical protein